MNDNIRRLINSQECSIDGTTTMVNPLTEFVNKILGLDSSTCDITLQNSLDRIKSALKILKETKLKLSDEEKEKVLQLKIAQEEMETAWKESQKNTKNNIKKRIEEIKEIERQEIKKRQAAKALKHLGGNKPKI